MSKTDVEMLDEARDTLYSIYSSLSTYRTIKNDADRITDLVQENSDFFGSPLGGTVVMNTAMLFINNLIVSWNEMGRPENFRIVLDDGRSSIIHRWVTVNGEPRLVPVSERLEAAGLR